MSTWTGAKRKPAPDAQSDERCSYPFCTQIVTYRFLHQGIPFCQEHALDVWVRVNDMMNADDPIEYTPRPQHAEGYEGWIYYIRIGDRIKIGHSMDPDRRLASYPPNMEFLLMRRGSRKLERSEHLRFADHLADGREWFHVNNEVLDRIHSLTKELPAADVETTLPEYFPRRKTHQTDLKITHRKSA